MRPLTHIRTRIHIPIRIRTLTRALIPAVDTMTTRTTMIGGTTITTTAIANGTLSGIRAYTSTTVSSRIITASGHSSPAFSWATVT
ncbi:hypothetical protein ONZ51_g2335 [Trametes cubensis]|uniref:Uncharacterized protein n=1 Tax=Trametes cubensis TaxID=1111947 RepID=A0AAD7U268_9APHY|nr:hypothetical protein ONZ51_g2335 [Trametes cubensis]